ncbi:MAG: hypothetical protein ABEJ79_03960 [Halolamina sp.]
MTLSEYTGRALPDDEEGTVRRVTAHHRWTPAAEAYESCRNCGLDVRLRERHVLVVSEVGDAVERSHLCNEGCIAEWLNDE